MKTLILMFLLSYSFHLFAIVDGQEVEKNQLKGVVNLEIWIENSMSVCTATFVSKNTLISAAHCFREYLKAEKQNKSVEIMFPTREMELKKVVISEGYLSIAEQPGFEYFRTATDMAFVVLKNKVSNFPSYKVSFRGPRQDYALIVGFGGKEVMTLAEQNKRADDTLGVKRSGVTYIDEIESNGRLTSRTQKYQSSFWSSSSSKPRICQSSRGDSGGPVIQKGVIVGVISSSDHSDEKDGVVRSLKSFFAGVHSQAFKELKSEVIKSGGSIDLDYSK